jgi:hypothetical protein
LVDRRGVLVYIQVIESGGYVKREYVTIERKDVEMVLSDVELDRAFAAVFQTQILQADSELGGYDATQTVCASL